MITIYYRTLLYFKVKSVKDDRNILVENEVTATDASSPGEHSLENGEAEIQRANADKPKGTRPKKGESQASQIHKIM